ncbi:imm11 family protein [Vitiosangium sp. GDMCC 1.1324]|uniref:imm11 family protein n=1 Tax=Vitiosangium sp. (strain GDMCC 1.1324) TaxID=2138576 RepID=UPI000D3BF407|nr:DUF1629 domain-containing protein [Vitiosangium sp. GDMCC 1.1324]PTL75619.1 hypothetical protein DAT35_53285 [Vitiosangium sp. GDMCC 1.1324]
MLQKRGTGTRDKAVKPGSKAHARRYTFTYGNNFKIGQSPYVNQGHHMLPEEAFSDKFFDSNQLRMLQGVDYNINNGENIQQVREAYPQEEGPHEEQEALNEEPVSVSYYPWVNDDEDESFAWLDSYRKEELEGRGYLLKEGVPCKEWFPEGLIFDLSKERGSKLADSIPNTSALLVVSAKLKGILERDTPKDSIEFLSVRLRTPRKKVLDAPYFIANVLGSVACMDAKKSDFRMDSIIKDQVERFRRLVLQEKKIPKDTKIFRLAESTRLILIREDLGQTIVDEDCTGMIFQDLDDYGSEFRKRTKS